MSGFRCKLARKLVLFGASYGPDGRSPPIMQWVQHRDRAVAYAEN